MQQVLAARWRQPVVMKQMCVLRSVFVLQSCGVSLPRPMDVGPCKSFSRPGRRQTFENCPKRANSHWSWSFLSMLWNLSHGCPFFDQPPGMPSKNSAFTSSAQRSRKLACSNDMLPRKASAMSAALALPSKPKDARLARSAWRWQAWGEGGGEGV
jgi:hypothetical protein